MKKTAILFASLTILFACSEEKKTENASDVTPAQEIISNESTPVDPATNTVQTDPAQQIVQPIAAPASTAAPVAADEPVNPPHGEPNHRCDIAVGAPLSSPPGTGNAAPTPIAAPAPGATKLPTADSKSVTEKVIFQPDPNAPAGTISATPATDAPKGDPNAAVAPGMNPPHGEPGHDCSVAVGSPLPKK